MRAKRKRISQKGRCDEVEEDEMKHVGEIYSSTSDAQNADGVIVAPAATCAIFSASV